MKIVDIIITNKNHSYWSYLMLFAPTELSNGGRHTPPKSPPQERVKEKVEAWGSILGEGFFGKL